MGVRRSVSSTWSTRGPSSGDHVLVHVGFAIRRIAPEDLAETLAFFESLTADDLEGVVSPRPRRFSLSAPRALEFPADGDRAAGPSVSAWSAPSSARTASRPSP
ncbi:MAG: HypC/HybG/HupF family hydrogenase formation chaperone [Myxococcales bacterium]|nr:HypC/HybG/HupF family hydrogenase formation chaperone [Myxococcales bacterium]